ncbi:helix-turn-helix domain-containing protein [Streptomyces sp. NPDC001930]|uniref:helix-turn-helix domain-containing protein n=1 Tax=Streptomyces sp. NPDC001930 TaxID=3364625 RepID=UPI0036AF6C0B
MRALAGSGIEFDPILVERESGRVVDGMHRLRATILRGGQDIAVRYVDGSPADLFIMSVQANSGHGLPLTLKDRKAAAARILASHHEWSDRAIAEVVGLSPKTVGAARGKVSIEETPHSNGQRARRGRDGRLRPVNVRERRETARELLTERPEATLREIAEKAGVSISTVHRLRQAAQDEPDTELTQEESVASAAVAPSEALAATSNIADQPSHTTSLTPALPPATHLQDAARTRALRVLSNDPSIRFTDSGRMLLRWLNSQALELVAGERLLPAVPPHCLRAVAEVASHYAKEWERLAGVLQQGDRRFEPQ